MEKDNKKSGRIRTKRIKFTQVSNEALLDKNLSSNAFRLYAIIQHFITIPDFVLYKDYLRTQIKIGEKAFDAAWKQLKDQGYLIQYKEQDKENKNQFCYEYELLDVPNKKENKENSQYPKNGGVDNSQYPISEGVADDVVVSEGVESGGLQDGGSPKGGTIYNTDPSDTNSINTIGKENEEVIEEHPLSSPNELEEFYKTIKNEVTEITFKTWIKSLELKSKSKDKIVFEAPNKFTKEIVDSRYKDLIVKHTKKLYDITDIEIEIKEAS